MVEQKLEYSHFRKLPFGIEPKREPRETDDPNQVEDDNPDEYLGENDPVAEKPPTPTKPPPSKKPDKPDPEDKVDVPGKFIVLEETIRWTPDGQQVVDVVIAFETGDDPGVAFEHKVTKA